MNPGRDVQLSRDGQNLRGRAYGKTVSLSLQDNEVGGTVGSQLARLNLETKGDVTEAQGNFAGSLTRLHLGPEAPTGTVGRCSYDLKATKNGDYQGKFSMAQLLPYGTMGVGAFDALDGEMMALDGRVYRFAADGTASEVDPDAGQGGVVKSRAAAAPGSVTSTRPPAAPAPPAGRIHAAATSPRGG